MFRLYDNGYKLLGTKRDIEKYETKVMREMQDIGDDYVVETCEEILDIIKDYNDNTIFMINYDNGMGFTFETWQESDEVKFYE